MAPDKKRRWTRLWGKQMGHGWDRPNAEVRRGRPDPTQRGHDILRFFNPISQRPLRALARGRQAAMHFRTLRCQRGIATRIHQNARALFQGAVRHHAPRTQRQ
jgi:hypothetical protein